MFFKLFWSKFLYFKIKNMFFFYIPYLYISVSITQLNAIFKVEYFNGDKIARTKFSIFTFFIYINLLKNLLFVMNCINWAYVYFEFPRLISPTKTINLGNLKYNRNVPIQASNSHIKHIILFIASWSSWLQPYVYHFL
jgi:hypothetical protein